MYEVITDIREYKGPRGNYYGNEAGFQIQTNNQVITLAIDDESSCCEHWGYFLTEDDTEKFIGATLRDVRVTDTNRSSYTFSESWKDEQGHVSLDAGDVMFVDIITTEGTLQFVAYNAHNGYYGHSARVSSDQLKHEAML